MNRQPDSYCPDDVLNIMERNTFEDSCCRISEKIPFSSAIPSDNISMQTSTKMSARKLEQHKPSHLSYSSLPFAHVTHDHLIYHKSKIPLTSRMLNLQQNPKAQAMHITNGNSLGLYTSEPESNYDSDIGALSSKYTSLDRRRNDERR